MKILNLFHEISSKSLFMSYSRKMGFKVLNGTLNDPVIAQAEMRSKATQNIMNQLSKFVKRGGGDKAIHRHTVTNKKMLVRERLKLLFDSDFTFFEIGSLAGINMDYGNVPAAGFVAGIGKIHGRFCIVGANDATVKGGTVFPITVLKLNRVQQLSYLNKLPCIYLVDGGGAFLPLQAEIFPDKNHGGRCFYNEAVLSSLNIPQIAVVCGSCTAGSAYIPTMTEEAVIVNKAGTIFLAGPPLVKAATGEVVSEQDLGGATMHCSVSGCTDYFAEDEMEAMEMCRDSVLALNLPTCEGNMKEFSEPLFPAQDLSHLSGKEHLTRNDMYLILSRILDGSRFKEFKEKFGENLITGFGFLKGCLIGILANCNALSYQDAQKGTHFIQLCEKRKIPMCFLQNSGESSAPDSQLYGDNLRNKAKMVRAHSCSQVPKITLCVGGCYEDDNFTMCGWDFNPNFFLSWPLSHISSETGNVQKVKSEETKMLGKLNVEDLEDCMFLFDTPSSALHKSSRMLCDAVIAPQDTREVLSICLNIVNSYH